MPSSLDMANDSSSNALRWPGHHHRFAEAKRRRSRSRSEVEERLRGVVSCIDVGRDPSVASQETLSKTEC